MFAPVNLSNLAQLPARPLATLATVATPEMSVFSLIEMTNQSSAALRSKGSIPFPVTVERQGVQVVSRFKETSPMHLVVEDGATPHQFRFQRLPSPGAGWRMQMYPAGPVILPSSRPRQMQMMFQTASRTPVVVLWTGWVRTRGKPANLNRVAAQVLRVIAALDKFRETSGVATVSLPEPYLPDRVFARVNVSLQAAGGAAHAGIAKVEVRTDTATPEHLAVEVSPDHFIKTFWMRHHTELAAQATEDWLRAELRDFEDVLLDVFMGQNLWLRNGQLHETLQRMPGLRIGSTVARVQ